MYYLSFYIRFASIVDFLVLGNSCVLYEIIKKKKILTENHSKNNGMFIRES